MNKIMKRYLFRKFFNDMHRLASFNFFNFFFFTNLNLKENLIIMKIFKQAILNNQFITILSGGL
jgi:hypothetical protein